MFNVIWSDINLLITLGITTFVASTDTSAKTNWDTGRPFFGNIFVYVGCLRSIFVPLYQSYQWERAGREVQGRAQALSLIDMLNRGPLDPQVLQFTKYSKEQLCVENVK